MAKTTPVANPDIELAMNTFRENLETYFKCERYYRGDHDLQFATDKFRNTFGTLFKTFALNLCPAIVDAPRDKLIVTEFGVEDAADSAGAEQIANEAWKIWCANRMEVRAGQIHKEALKTGNAYAIVWPDAKGRPVIYPNKATTCMVVYDEDTPGTILWAAKFWRMNDRRFRLNLFYPDRVEKYVTKEREPEQYMGVKQAENKEGTTPLPMYVPEPKSFTPIAEGSEVANPYGRVPVFHFANNSEIGGIGVSELQSAIPIQDALNKSVLDMLVAMEFAAFRQRWISGIEVEYDEDGKPKPPFMAGIEKLWITENPDAKFGDFESTELKQFLEVKDGFRTDMAAVTGTPLHYFMQIGANFPSGESLKKAEQRFVNKVRDRQASFGETWANVMSFSLQISNKGKDVELTTEWEDPAPLSEADELSNLVTKQSLGVPEEQLWMEAGYGEDDIKRFGDLKAAELDKMAKSFNAGDLTGDPNASGTGPAK